ncbi:hypothetical protein OPV22_027157 [Ensete ventricosum]|uniref:PGG domain-containing protein n=1 Tax=Ensete ventricosum TaxID=4639 RepID=A0AAV8PZ44_ENSVE|nr:hypothetical protein OPV22_027157 [Ensete ventricosum]
MHAMGNPAPAIDADPPHEIDRRRFLTLKSHIRREKHEELLAPAVEDPGRPVNLMNDYFAPPRHSLQHDPPRQKYYPADSSGDVYRRSPTDAQELQGSTNGNGLVVAVMFASSFSVPGDKDPATGNSLYFGRAAFKVFSHAYVIGLSCAATSLVLFLSLAMSPYKEQQFRRIIPTKCFFARSSFGLAILSFLVAFACNIYLQLYGWQKTKSKHLIPFVLELTVFPVICFLVLFLRGFEFDLSFLSRSWR